MWCIQVGMGTRARTRGRVKEKQLFVELWEKREGEREGQVVAGPFLSLTLIFPGQTETV